MNRIADALANVVVQDYINNNCLEIPFYLPFDLYLQIEIKENYINSKLRLSLRDHIVREDIIKYWVDKDKVSYPPTPIQAKSL